MIEQRTWCNKANLNNDIEIMILVVALYILYLQYVVIVRSTE